MARRATTAGCRIGAALLIALAMLFAADAAEGAKKKPKIVTKDYFVADGPYKTVAKASGVRVFAGCDNSGGDARVHVESEGGTYWASSAGANTRNVNVGDQLFGTSTLASEGDAQGELIALSPDRKTVITVEFAVADDGLGGTAECLAAGTASVATKGAKGFIGRNLDGSSSLTTTLYNAGGFTARGDCTPPISLVRLEPGSIYQSAINASIDTSSGLSQTGLYPPPPAPSTRRSLGAHGIGDYVYADATGTVVSFKLGTSLPNSISCGFHGLVQSANRKSAARVLYSVFPDNASTTAKTKFYDDGQLELWADCEADFSGNQHNMRIYARSETDNASIYFSNYRHGEADPTLFEIDDLDAGAASEQLLDTFSNGPPGRLTRAGNLTYVSASGKVTTIDYAGAVQVGYDPCLFAGIAA